METNLLLETHLRQLQLPTSLWNSLSFAADAIEHNQDHVRYLSALTVVEVVQREQNRKERCIKIAYSLVFKKLDNFDFLAIPSFDNSHVQDLAWGENIAKREAILLVDNPAPIT